MKTLANNIRLQYDEYSSPEIVLTTTATQREAQEAVSALKAVVAKGKPLAVEVKQHRAKRSLDANAYLWAILSQMAVVLHTTKDELYLEMLSRYGIFTHLIVKPDTVERIKREWRTVRELGEVTVNGKTGAQLQVYFGSSGYDSAEFSVLLNGVIEDAKEIGIEVISDSEKDLLISEWGK